MSETTDWRDGALQELKDLIHRADPDIVEEVKWVKPSNPDGVAAFSHAGMVCTGEVYKQYVKVTFFHGAALPDPTGLFNAGRNGGTRRAIDVREGESVDPEAFVALVQAAVAHNLATRS